MNGFEIRIQFKVKRADGSAGSSDDAYLVAAQVNEDALFGTFAELDRIHWADKMDRQPEHLSKFELGDPVDKSEGRHEFKLWLAEELFPPEFGGINHLFGMLSGDLLRFVLPPLIVSDFCVKEIKAPRSWRDKHVELFRQYASSIEDTRISFNLPKEMPLLAFSFKPRVGFKIDALEEIARQVLSAGFNIVELDTRFLPLDKKHLDKLKDLAKSIADTNWGGHVGRLSLNFSLPSAVLLDEVRSFCSDIPAPVVFKIDGGFSGIDAIQSIRRAELVDASGASPIITCYPLLRSTLADYVPPDEFLDALIVSGADIIYPGNRPDIGKMKRSLDGNSEKSFVQSVQRYRKLTTAGEAMPTIAGGIYAGQLHAYYELLGPNVAWFLGGGVALHRDGPRAGAELCVEVAREAANLRAKAGQDWSGNLSGKLAEKCDEAYSGTSTLERAELIYFSPRERLSIDNLKPVG